MGNTKPIGVAYADPDLDSASISGSLTVGNSEMSGTELGYLDGITPGTATASKAVVLDANKDIATLRHITISGNLVIGATTLSETDLAKIDGITNGTQAAGKAVVADSNTNTGISKVTELHIGTSGSETQVTATAAELNYNDIASLGTGAASKAVVLDAGGDFIMPAAGLFGLSREALAATGSTAADAAVITQQVTAVTGANGTLAVALPAAATTIGPLLVINTATTTGATLPVFPVNGGNDNINAGAEDAAFTLGPGQAGWFIPTSGTQYYVVPASAATPTVAELNILTGVTATTAEINTTCDQSGQVLTPGAGITAGVGTVYKSSITKHGDIFKTTIFLDLTGLASTTTADDIIGTAGVCHLGQITAAKNGTLFFGQITCLETPAGGDLDIDFWSATENSGAYDALVTDLTETIMRANGGNWAAAAATQIAFTNVPAADKYMYMAVGSAGGAPGTYTAGQFLIELYGY